MSQPVTESASAPAPAPSSLAEVEPRVVTRAELPLSCPLPEAPLWSAHPKVYLPIEANGAATCPYCGARFILQT